MNCSKNILRAAVAAALGVAAGQAAATIDYTSASPQPARFAKELPTSSTTATTLTNAGALLDFKIAVPTNYSISTTSPLFVKIQLSGNARFVAAPEISCGATAAGANNNTGGQITIGGLGDSAVTFNIGNVGAAAGATAITSGNCVITGFGGIVFTGLTNKTLSAQIEYKNGLADVVSGASVSYITFANGFSATVASAGVVVVDATSGSDNFVTGGGAFSQSTASLGTVNFRAVTPAPAASAIYAANGTTALELSAALASGSITVTGAGLGAGLAANGTSGVFLSLGACTAPIALSSTALNSVSFTGISPTNLSAGLTVCMNVSGGTTVILTGAIGAQVGGVGATNVTVDFAAAAGSLSTLSQNGTTKNAYFINASSSASKTSVIRIVNTGGNSGTIRATAYLVGEATADGTQVGTANATIGTLTTNQSISLTSAALETLLGYTPASGTVKYRVVFSAGLANFTILNFTRDVVGGYITLSQAQDN